MKYFLIAVIILITSAQQDMSIFDFNNEETSRGWYIINDGVMGGLSQGQFFIENGQGIFKGLVSTKNNGGFTMLQKKFDPIIIEKYSSFIIKVKGDGKAYQFRVKSEKNMRHSFVYEFITNGEWQEISIPFSSLVPRFRGRSVDVDNFNGSKIEELAFLIGNKRNESFQLSIQSIEVK